MDSRPLVVSVVGTRPNFVKLAAVSRAFAPSSPFLRHAVIHTGQHYDPSLSQWLFEDLGLGEPDLRCDPPQGHPQLSWIMTELECVLKKWRPAYVLVYGDVTSTLAASLVAWSLGIRVGHVEAGLRCGDYALPEEMNRALVDRLASDLFSPSQDAQDHLKEERCPGRAFLVGNVMIDTLLAAAESMHFFAKRQAVRHRRYIFATFHRQENVDTPEALDQVVDILVRLALEWYAVEFPVHPRTWKNMSQAQRVRLRDAGVRVFGPVGYRETLEYLARAECVVTDSGGLQEETSALGVPCLTVRSSTERPITISHGTNRLRNPKVGAVAICEAVGLSIDAYKGAPPSAIPYWDGHAAERLVQIVERALT